MLEDRNSPIFVVGCQRSGTTLLRLMLDSHPRISCGPETRFLADLAAITGSNWQRMRLYQMSKEEWHARIAGFFDGIQTDYASARGKERWADKTPMYARCIPFLDDLFPTCRVVHVIRDGRDVVASHRKRWGTVAAAKAAAKWPRYVTAARSAGSGLPTTRYREVRYEDLVGRTEETLRGLLDWLSEEWDPAVLEYDLHPHDVPDRYRTLTAARREAASTGSVYNSSVGSYRRELGLPLRAVVQVLAGGMLRELGYR